MAEQSFRWPGRRTDDPAHDMLAAFLVMDIQRNPDWAHQLADRLVQVKTGKLPVSERIGNAYRLELTAQGALIEDLVDEDSAAQEITLEEFSKALEAWIKSFESED
jgi:hypothetical protein